MNRVVAIAANTFRETIRDRILLVILLFALAMIVAGIWLASISLGQEGRLMQDFGLLAISGFAVLVAVFVGAGLVRKEIDKRTVFILFSKPVGRGEFLAGKYLGLGLTMAIVVFGMTVFLFLLAWPFAGAANGWVIVAGSFIYLQVMVVLAVTIFFSTFASPILAAVLGISVYGAGQLSHNVLSLTRLGEGAFLEGLSWVVYLLVPNFGAVNLSAVVVGEQAPDWSSIGGWAGYLVAYAVLMLGASWLVFRRKEF
jgi:ABC-type transport system involved in multi-copper enzyme maturation permease subunit